MPAARPPAEKTYAKRRPPQTYQAFVRRYPELARAWDIVAEAGRAGPLDEQVRLLVKLGIAIGALREGAVHSAARKARAAGVSDAALEQVVALATSTLGFPSTVAAWSWVRDDGPERRR